MPFNDYRLHLQAAAVFLASLGVGGVLIHLFEQGEIYRRQRAAMEVAAIHGHLLQEQTARSLSATYALAAVLKQGGGRLDNFDDIAAEMLPLYGGISSLQLAPGGVIRQVVPLAGNEAAIGHDLLVDPQRNKEAFAAVATHKLTLAGPFTLRQGGVAVVGRLPVFYPDPDGKEVFWGFTTALIKIPELLAASRLRRDPASDYHYALSRVHPDSGRTETFWTSDAAALKDPLAYRIEVPNGEWTLHVAPVNGWHSSPALLLAGSLAVLLVSALAGILTYRILREPYLLARQVEERTRELSLANDNLQAEILKHWQTELALRESESRLEARVEERTLQLAAANDALQQESLRQTALVEKLEAAQNQLLQAEMMASIGQLAAGVAHEINNPIGFINSNLGALQAYATAMLKALATADQAVCAACDIDYIREELPLLLTDTQQGVERIRKIVQDLKDFSHVDASDWQLLDLHRGIDSALNLLAKDIQGRVELLRDYGDIPAIECHPFQINQVFFNLLLNAVQAIPAHGRVTVRSRRDGAWIVIEVVDTGCGIAPENRGRIFEPFFTTRPVGSGTGLGLSLAYSIVKRHGGCLEVDSEPGRGATFRVWLPISGAA